MSSILDALKKVEQSSNSLPKKNVQALITSTTEEQVLSHTPPQKMIRTHWPVWFLLIVMVSIVIIVVYDQRISRVQTLPSPATVQVAVEKTTQPLLNVPEILQNVRIPAKKPVETIQETPQEPVEIAQKKSEDTLALERENLRKTIKSSPVEQPAEKETSLITQGQAIQIDQPTSTTRVIQNEQTDIDAQPETIEHASMIKQEPLPVVQELPVLESGILKLQAITWSPIAEKRFIMVNNSISRIKDRINGYIVLQINMDSIVVQQRNNDKKWLVEFRTR